jgi:hypothetical protein
LRLNLDAHKNNSRNYCDNPIDLSQLTDLKANSPSEKIPDKKITDFDQSCDCKTCLQTCEKKELDGQDEREISIEFENEIQDFVWKKQEEPKPQPQNIFGNRKAKRQADLFSESAADNKMIGTHGAKRNALIRYQRTRRI